MFWFAIPAKGLRFAPGKPILRCIPENTGTSPEGAICVAVLVLDATTSRYGKFK